MKSVFTVLVKRNGTEEFDLIKILNKFCVDIFYTFPFLHAFSGCNTSSGRKVYFLGCMDVFL